MTSPNSSVSGNHAATSTTRRISAIPSCGLTEAPPSSPRLRRHLHDHLSHVATGAMACVLALCSLGGCSQHLPRFVVLKSR